MVSVGFPSCVHVYTVVVVLRRYIRRTSGNCYQCTLVNVSDELRRAETVLEEGLVLGCYYK